MRRAATNLLSRFTSSPTCPTENDRQLLGFTALSGCRFVTGADRNPPDPQYHLFATGLHEVFGLAWRDGSLYATQQGEVTRLVDRDGDGRADRYETISDRWGFGDEHEFTFGSNFDRDGFIWVVHCLSASYTSDNPFRGWYQRIAADGTTTPMGSGIRSPGGVGMNADGVMFYTESQGPWNGANSLRPLVPGGFMGHPISFPWYRLVPELGQPPAEPTGGRTGRRHLDAERIPELVMPAVVGANILVRVSSYCRSVSVSISMVPVTGCTRVPSDTLSEMLSTTTGSESTMFSASSL